MQELPGLDKILSKIESLTENIDKVKLLIEKTKHTIQADDYKLNALINGKVIPASKQSLQKKNDLEQKVMMLKYRIAKA